MKIPFLQVANRITGFSTPVFGISWEPPHLEVDTARQLLTYLEDRRALYSPYELEMPNHVVMSILQIRQRLSSDLEALDRSALLAESITAMRAACRKFFDHTRTVDTTIPMHKLDFLQKMVFVTALGELRGVFGIHIARISTSYGVDVEDQLAIILPASEDEKDETLNRNVDSGRHQ